MVILLPSTMTNLRVILSDNAGALHARYARPDGARTKPHGISEHRTKSSEIAQRVGYESEIALSRAFRRFMGTSPGAYRKTRPLPHWLSRKPASNQKRRFVST